MSTTLTNGLKLPDKGSVDWYADMQNNYTILDGAVGTIAEHTTALAGKAPLVHTHTKSDVTDLFNSANVWTESNSYTGIVLLNSSSDVAEQFQQKLPKDVSTSNDAMARVNSLVDSAGHYVVVETLGHWSNYAAKSITLRYKNDSTKQGAVEFRLYPDGSGIFYPQSPFECNLGNAGNQWKSVYAQSYYYNGDEFQNKFVTLDSVQTITGEKTFSKSVVVSVGSSVDSGYSVIANVSRKDVGDGKYYGTYIHAGVASGPGALGIYGYIRNTDGTSELQMRLITSKSDGNFILKALQFQADRYGDTWQFIPSTNNTIDLGTSSFKWKTLNGINPGALSLPDYTHYEPINFSQWNTSGALTNTYTPTEDGWLYVNIKDTATNSIYIYAKSIPGAQSYSVSVYGNGSQGLTGRLATIIPVIKGITYAAVIKASSVNDIYAVTFFPALGNV